MGPSKLQQKKYYHYNYHNWEIKLENQTYCWLLETSKTTVLNLKKQGVAAYRPDHVIVVGKKEAFSKGGETKQGCGVSHSETLWQISILTPSY